MRTPKRRANSAPRAGRSRQDKYPSLPNVATQMAIPVFQRVQYILLYVEARILPCMARSLLYIEYSLALCVPPRHLAEAKVRTKGRLGTARPDGRLQSGDHTLQEKKLLHLGTLGFTVS